MNQQDAVCPRCEKHVVKETLMDHLAKHWAEDKE